MNKIDWSKWSAIAEILSAIAIVVTLLYLAIQTAQNTQAIKASAARDVARDEAAAINTLVADPELFVLLDRDELSPTEAIRLHAFLSVFTRSQENYWTQYTLGVIDRDRLERYQAAFSTMLANANARRWWASQKQWFDPQFVTRIDALLAGFPANQTQSVAETVQGLFRTRP